MAKQGIHIPSWAKYETDVSQVQIPPIRLNVFWQKVQFDKPLQEEHVGGH